MSVDEAILRAYVDGELTAPRREQIELLVSHDDALRRQVRALRASCLPYRSAFDVQLLPPMPQSILQQVESWSKVADSVLPARAFASSNPKRWLAIAAAIVASFSIGLIVNFSRQPAAQIAADASPWVDVVAAYHSLYVRATVDQSANELPRVRRTLSEFVTPQNKALTVPDLSKSGLAFKRLQRLGYRDVPVAQMIYLPDQGKPVALCALPIQRPDSPVVLGHMSGLNVASWQQDGFAYVLAADIPAGDTAKIAEQLAASEFPVLRLPET
jgi:anti-sigma factor RsiW